jgi:hypothetical protein
VRNMAENRNGGMPGATMPRSLIVNSMVEPSKWLVQHLTCLLVQQDKCKFGGFKACDASLFYSRITHKSERRRHNNLIHSQQTIQQHASRAGHETFCFCHASMHLSGQNLGDSSSGHQQPQTWLIWIGTVFQLYSATNIFNV